MRVRRWSFSVCSLVLMLLGAYAPCARADLFTAQQAYNKGDFPSAFQQFKELAELGQPEAQYALAAMYVRGEGVEINNTFAHAWASLAASNGKKTAKDLVDRLTPLLTPASLRLSSDMQTQYGAARLEARLMPKFLKGRDYQDREPVRADHAYAVSYPPDAQRYGIQGEVYVEFVVPPDGHPRLPRILYAIPEGHFESTVLDGVLRSTYLPARINGQPVSTTVSVFYNFVMRDTTIKDYGNLESRVKATETKAQAGDPAAQMLLGMMIAGLPQLKRTYDQALPWFVKAAQAGSPYAQYQVGTGLLRGHGCECDITKAEVWLQKAAQADQADAQVTLAEFLLRDSSHQEGVAGALVWLERAMKSGNRSAKLLSSAIFAASPTAEHRDPPRALALADEIERTYRRDPVLWEIRAAALASQGDFKAATKAQTQAIDRAKDLGWDLAKLNERQAAYAARQAWSGDLLSF